ncbi:hypothetical protein CI807_12240 [Pseudomonas sp. NS1(2017)]|jgi:hypothetical protein|uniref:hypothetical protein n=1 Tax=Pseudomonas sp. NS1(2017) TaxID=2025658 RepID=UPI000BA1EE6E|nr:hypothetical protein [Pseudomonas sp. NS1(2017)]ASV36919.1 hypothetical protein CI807_12240 [Pseudomonas sp. NS1(2017)]
MTTQTKKSPKSPTTGTLTATIEQKPALNADFVHVHYVNNSMEIYGNDSRPEALLTSVTITVVRDVKSGTYELYTDSDFQSAEVRYNGLPYLYDTESATLHITADHKQKHSFGTCTIKAVAVFDPENRITVEVEFDLHGGTDSRKI